MGSPDNEKNISKNLIIILIVLVLAAILIMLSPCVLYGKGYSMKLTKLENSVAISQVITNIFLIISAVIAVYQYCSYTRNEEEAKKIEIKWC